MGANTFYHANDNLLEVKGLTDAVNAAAIDTATVTVTVTDQSGVAVAGVAWPLAFTARGAGGDYHVTLPDSLGLALGQTYLAEIVADDGADRRAAWTFRFSVSKRTE